MDICVAGVGRGNDVERIPDRAQPCNAPEQEVELPNGVTAAKEATDASGRVDARVDADRECQNLTPRGIRQERKRSCDLRGDDRALFGAFGIEKRDEDDLAAQLPWTDDVPSI